MNRVLYIAEGEIEGRFLDFLKRENFICPGKFKKFNLLQNRLSDNDDILTKTANRVFGIIDADLLTGETLNKLVENVKTLRGICPRGTVILIQNENFEDELKYLLDCKDLCKFLSLKYNTSKDLKEYLASSVNYQNFIRRDMLVKYCSRFQPFKEHLEQRNVRVKDLTECLVNFPF